VFGKENNMKAAGNPVRLHTLLGRDSVLGRGIAAAQACGPTDDQLKALERGVLAGLAAVSATTVVMATAQGSKPATWLSLGTTKLVLALVVGATLGGGAALVWQKRHAPPAPPAARAWPERPSAPAPAVEAPKLELAPPGSAGPATGAANPVGKVKARMPSPGSRREASRRDDAEVTLLERAHQALSGSPALALTLAREHGRRFPVSTLDQERELIQVTALVELGRHQEARRLARRFSAQHPDSAYVGRIDEMLQQLPER
jgi:hypothetical protein